MLEDISMNWYKIWDLQKNALLGGALTGAALPLTEPNPRTDHIISGAITGGAIATAAEFLRSLTY